MPERNISDNARVRVTVKLEKFKDRQSVQRGQADEVLERIREEPLPAETRRVDLPPRPPGRDRE